MPGGVVVNWCGRARPASIPKCEPFRLAGPLLRTFPAEIPTQVPKEFVIVTNCQQFHMPSYREEVKLWHKNIVDYCMSVT